MCSTVQLAYIIYVSYCTYTIQIVESTATATSAPKSKLTNIFTFSTQEKDDNAKSSRASATKLMHTDSNPTDSPVPLLKGQLSPFQAAKQNLLRAVHKGFKLRMQASSK